jgi:hypothetical protein
MVTFARSHHRATSSSSHQSTPTIGVGLSGRVAVTGYEATAPWHGALVEPLASLYLFEDFEAVRNFLLTVPHVDGALFDGYPHIASVFGTATPLTLRVESDPDDGGVDELILSIRSKLDLNIALALLDRLDEQWWRNASARVPRLVVDVE